MPVNINFSKFWAFVGILVPPLIMSRGNVYTREEALEEVQRAKAFLESQAALNDDNDADISAAYDNLVSN